MNTKCRYPWIAKDGCGVTIASCETNIYHETRVKLGSRFEGMVKYDECSTTIGYTYDVKSNVYH